MSSDLEMYLLLNEIASQGVNEKYKKRLYDARSLDRSQLIRINASFSKKIDSMRGLQSFKLIVAEHFRC